MNPVLSPDGREVALNRSVAGNADIWRLELSRMVLSRFTFDPTPEIYPVWSPDGRRIAYGHMNGSGTGFMVYQKPISGDGQGSPLFETAANTLPLDWSHDGRFVLFMTLGPSGDWDLGAMPMNGGRKTAITVAHTNYNERTGQFSPDGHWIAFESDESGRDEIYVQAFPEPASKTIVSTGGGIEPRWSPTGRELFYVAPDGRLMTVALRFADNGHVEPNSPTAMFVTRVGSTHTGGSGVEYAVAADGERFLMNTLVEQAPTPITLVLNANALRN
jgi:Tol biopolymer transport system component